MKIVHKKIMLGTELFFVETASNLFPLIPIFSIKDGIWEWYSISKSFDKSIKTPIVGLLIFYKYSFSTQASWVDFFLDIRTES